MDLTSRGRCHEADKRDKNAQPVGPMNKQTNEKKLIERILGNKTEEVKMGLDVHARDVVMCVQEDNSLAQRPQRTSGAQVVTLVHGLAKAGCKVYVSQEAGPCGFGLHRELTAAGAHNYVVVPRTLADGRKQKTDGLDALALTDALDRYQRGNTKVFSAVRVPTIEEEQHRDQSRYRDQLKIAGLPGPSPWASGRETHRKTT